MELGHSSLSRRTFNALAMTVLPAVQSRADGVEDRRAQFARDVARSYECQYVAVDMYDVNSVFRDVRSPVLGVGVATGPNRPALATQAAMRDAGRLGDHNLVVIAFPPRGWRLSEYTLVVRNVSAELSANATVIYGICDDERLTDGGVRVSVLTG